MACVVCVAARTLYVVGCSGCKEPDHEAGWLVVQEALFAPAHPTSGLWRGRKVSAARRVAFISSSPTSADSVRDKKYAPAPCKFETMQMRDNVFMKTTCSLGFIFKYKGVLKCRYTRRMRSRARFASRAKRVPRRPHASACEGV